MRHTHQDANSTSQVDIKPTKSAIKRAQKLARIEKKQKQKALAKALRVQAPTSPASSQSEVSLEPHTNLDNTRNGHLSDTDENENATSSQSSSISPVAEEPESCQSPAEVNGACSASRVSSSEHLNATSIDSKPRSLLSQPAQEALTERSEDTTPPPKQDSVPQQPSPDLEKMKKRQGFITRTLWTFIMIGGFIGEIYSFLLFNLSSE
jgi:phosphatidate cytidylyltransferase